MSAATLELAADADAFARLGGEWDPLVRAMARPSPFLLHAWLCEWWAHFGAGARLEVRQVRREGRLVAAIPLHVRSERTVPVARFLGGHESALADLLVAPDEEEAGQRLVESLVSSPAWEAAQLFGLPVASRLGSLLGDRLALLERSEAPVLDLSPGWAAVYEERTPSKRRSLHRRRRRQLAALGRLESVTARTADELRPALEEAFRLHDLRWRGRPDLSTFGTARGRAFHRAALESLAPAGVPRIVTLSLDGRPIAFQYFFVLERRMYVHRLAFDPAYARHSPGLVNLLDTLEVAAGEGVVRVEFLGGTERYKVELADRLEPLYEGFGLATTLRGRALTSSRHAALRARRWLKRSETIRRLYYDRLGRIVRR